jgi:hypothetical protein
MASFKPQLIYPEKESTVPNTQDAGWAQELVWMKRRGEKTLLYQDSKSEPSVVLPITSCYNDSAILALDQGQGSLK